CPDPAVSAPSRSVTTTPVQALALLNGSFTLRAADRLTRRVENEVESAKDPMAARVERVYQFMLQRTPTTEELRLARPLVKEHGLAAFCRALFNCDEFLLVE